MTEKTDQPEKPVPELEFETTPETEKFSSMDVYVRAKNEWMERYGSYIAQAKNWRMAFFAMAAISVILTGGNIYQASQNKVIPYIVEVDSLGRGRFVQLAPPAASGHEMIKRFWLSEFITNARSVTADGVAMKAMIDKAYTVADAAARNRLEDWHRRSSPFERARETLVSVQVNSVLSTSPTSFQVDWTEDVRGTDGYIIRTEQWRGHFTLSVSAISNEKEARINPFGIRVADFSWQRL